MLLPITQPWGKFKKDESFWHPLLHHTLDVMAVAIQVLQIPNIQKRLLKDWNSSLSKSQIAKLAFFVGLHDLGKYNDGFQSKTHQSTTVGHLKPAFSLFYEYPLQEILFSDTFCSITDWFFSEDHIDALYKASVSHHGQPLDVKDYSLEDISCWSVNKHKPLIQHHISSLWDILDLNNQDNKKLPISNEFLFIFSGLVQFSDWVGSDTRFFPYSESESLIERFNFASLQANQFLKDLGWTNLDLNHIQQTLSQSNFSSILPFNQLHSFQQIIFDNFKPSFSRTEIIEAQTGGGKTEIAVLRGLQYLSQGLVDSIVFALPSIASARQIYKRVKTILEKSFPLYCPHVLLATSSDVGKNFHTIKNAEKNLVFKEDGIWDDTDPSHILSKLWCSDYSKKFLSGTFVVGTIDQILMSGLQIKHSMMLGFFLSRSFLIVDEVHSSDVYSMKILENILRDHRKLGGVSLLLSATLTEGVKNNLLDKKSTLRDPYSVSYPVLSSNNDCDIALPLTEEKEFEVFIDNNNDYNHLSDTLLDMANKGAKVCLIKNTVKYAVLFQKTLEDRAKMLGLDHLIFKVNGVSCPFHAKYSENAKKVISTQLEKDFDKKSLNRGLVLVATQVVQQSLDIDFDYMVSDLCPMDLLIQRAGRLHRHKKVRPSGFTVPCLTILSPLSLVGAGRKLLNSLGIGTVYKNLVELEAVLLNIQENSKFKVNAESRWRIENTLGKNIVNSYVEKFIGKTNFDILDNMSLIHKGEEFSHKSLAMSNLYSRSDTYLSFEFDRGLKNVKTRIGDDSVFVHFKDIKGDYLKLDDIFGGVFMTLTLPLRDLENGVDLSKEVIGIAVRDPLDLKYEITIGNGNLFIYSRLGFLKKS